MRKGWTIAAAALALVSTGGASAPLGLGAQPQQLLSVALRTRDVAAARRFYMEVVGLKELPGSTPAAKPVQISMLSFSGGYDQGFLILSNADADGARAVPPGTLQRIAFKVADAAAVAARARAAGATIVSPPAPAHGMAGLIVAMLRAPDGNLVEIVQTPG